MSPLNKLAEEGQAVWLDFVERKFLAEDGLQTLIARDGVTGVTSNPSIFEQAMSQGKAYDAALAGFDRAYPDASTRARYEFLAIGDIRAAADDLRDVYDRLDARDGYVSFEVSPLLAMDSDGTIAEAARLWATTDRPNLMIKITLFVASNFPAKSQKVSSWSRARRIHGPRETSLSMTRRGL